MSIARVKTVQRAQKDPGKCEGCGTELHRGDAYRWFKVGFRSRLKRIRCMKPECTPRPSDLESSKMSQVYAAQEAAEDDIAAAASREDIEAALEVLAQEVQQTAEEYREASVNQNTGVVFNVDAEEKAERLEEYASELEQVDLESAAEGAGLEECEHCGGGGICVYPRDHEDDPVTECPDEGCGASNGDGKEGDCGICDGTGNVDRGEDEGEDISDEELEAMREAAREAIGALEM